MISPLFNGSIGPFPPLVTWSNKNKNAALQHLTYFKPFAYAPAKAGSTLLV